MNTSPLLYPDAVERLKRDLQRAVTDYDYLSGISGDGPIAEFEAEFARIVGGKYAIALTNATSALFVALMASGIRRGDEVILPSYTWPQTLTPVLLTGATPVFADIEDNSVTISPESVERLITKNTKAIIAAHIYGIPADIGAMEKIAKSYGCALIFDAAQGFGAIWKDKPIGAYGDYVAFSFGRSKLFSVGEGGALICRTRDHYERAIAISQHPLRMHRDIDNAEMRCSIDGVSMNFRMHPLIASLALGQLKGLLGSGRMEYLRARFREMYEAFTVEKRGILPKFNNHASPSGVCFPVFVKDKKSLSSLNGLRNVEIYGRGLQRPLHLTNTIRRRKLLGYPGYMVPRHKTHKPGSCPNSERLCDKGLFFLKACDTSCHKSDVRCHAVVSEKEDL